MAISPTAEGFRAAFRRPSLTLGEIAWRWTTGGTAAVLFFFGLFEYLYTLPVTNGELLFLRTRHPYLVSEAIAHILRGSLNRVVMTSLLAVLALVLLWIVAGAVGRIATVGAMLNYFREHFAGIAAADSTENDAEEAARNVAASPMRPLIRLNFLRTALALAAILGFAGAAILAGFASPDSNPRPGLAFLLFLPMAALICLAWWVLNWLLQLAGMFAVRDGEDAVGAISAALDFCRERTGAVFAVSTWTALAHAVAFVAATTVVSMPLGFMPLVPWRLVVAAMIVVTLVYFAVADWIYMARLAGYVCIAEMPEAILAPLPPPPQPAPTFVARPPLQTTIDRDEPILSDLPIDPAGAFYVECEMCITCRAPEAVAPDLIGFSEDASGTSARSHCYFKKQPETPTELERAIKAVWANCCGAYHYAGRNTAIKEKAQATRLRVGDRQSRLKSLPNLPPRFTPSP